MTMKCSNCTSSNIGRSASRTGFPVKASYCMFAIQLFSLTNIILLDTVSFNHASLMVNIYGCAEVAGMARNWLLNRENPQSVHRHPTKKYCLPIVTLMTCDDSQVPSSSIQFQSWRRTGSKFHEILWNGTETKSRYQSCLPCTLHMMYYDSSSSSHSFLFSLWK